MIYTVESTYIHLLTNVRVGRLTDVGETQACYKTWKCNPLNGRVGRLTDVREAQACYI